MSPTMEKLNGEAESDNICCLAAKPLDDPVWRGLLVITNERYGSIYGIVAHLSSNACVKARQVAQRFPAVLDSEVVPKLDVWPTKFTRSPPTDNEIALYFFAEKGNEQLFESLLFDLIERDVAFKVLMDEAELLIFTSSQLPEQHQTIEGKSYLWGVFRRNKALTSCHMINKIKCIMPNNPIIALSSVVSKEHTLIKMRNNESETRSIHHEDARKSDCEEHEVQATVEVEPYLIAYHTHAESSVNADNALVESYMNADHTQDHDATKKSENQETGSTALVRNGAYENQEQLFSDSNHSMNTVNPVHSSLMNNSTEKALTHDPTATVMPSLSICTTIIPEETSLSQPQGITANLVDMARIFKGVDSHEDTTHSVKLGRYTIKQSLSLILESILDKYGDIAQRCQLSDESTSYILELICKVIQYLQQLSLNKLRSRHLKYINTIFTEARSVNIEVDWLKSRHDELEEMLSFASLKDDTHEKVIAAESAKGTVELKKVELLKAESEWASMEKELKSLEEEYQSLDAELSNMTSEVTLFLEKQLNDGLL